MSKNVQIGKLDDIVNESNNTYHRTIKMMLRRVHIDFDVNNGKDPKLKVGDPVKISNIKIILPKITLQVDLKKFLKLKK